MRVLIVDDDEDIREIIEFTFSCEVESDFVHAESGNKAIEIIKSSNDLDLIICDFNMPDGNGGDVYRFLVENDYSIPYVFCSSDYVSDHEDFNNKKNLIGEIIKPHIFEGVQKVIETFNSSNENEDNFVKNESLYLNVNLDLLLKSKKLPCDLYVKLKNDKILKILNQGDEFTSESFQKYKKKELEYLLIKKESSVDYVNHLCECITGILENGQGSDESKVFDTHSMIMTVVSQLGLSETVVKATSRSVDFAVNFFKQNKDFKKLERHIFQSPGSYLTKHSVALAFIASAVLKKSKWDSPDTRNKLVLASFLHDASIRKTDFDEAFFNDDNDLITLKDHPTEVLNLINKIKNIPPDLDRILLEHHERPDGSGYPRKLNGLQIHPLSSIFILSHDIVDTIFKLQLNNSDITDEMLQEEIKDDPYLSGHFKKSIDAFRATKLFL